MKSTVFIATSLDGFIARANGAIDWLPTDDPSSPDAPRVEEHGYEALMNSVDALVMGRNTFELVLTFDPWPYGSKPVIVLTSRPLMLPPHLPNTVEQLNLPPAALIDELTRRGMHHLYIDGGVTIQRFLAAGLIDQLIITRIPILLGAGIPLFGPLPQDIRLHHVSTRSFASGLVQSEYLVIQQQITQPRSLSEAAVTLPQIAIR